MWSVGFRSMLEPELTINKQKKALYWGRSVGWCANLGWCVCSNH